MSVYESLAAAPYISLATFRKSGETVATPMWTAGIDACLYMFTTPDAGKVKRLRNSSRVQVAVCNFKGALEGEWVPATASFVSDKAEIRAALSALRKKYGWQMLLADLGAKLIGRFPKRVYIRIELETAAG